jgi:hypothetical protein
MMIGAHSHYYSSKDMGTAPPNATTEQRQKAIEDFINYALSKSEVKVVPFKSILDWQKSPTAL